MADFPAPPERGGGSGTHRVHDRGRPPGEVFACLTDPSRSGEWQWGVASGRMEEDRPRWALKVTAATRIGGTEQTPAPEITEIGPPRRRWAVRGLDGPAQEMVSVTVEPLDDGTWQRLTACGNPDRRWAFYDRSHSRAGAWCDMATCGNRTKYRRLRHRQR